jgi:hypothetical protein
MTLAGAARWQPADIQRHPTTSTSIKQAARF